MPRLPHLLKEHPAPWRLIYAAPLPLALDANGQAVPPLLYQSPEALVDALERLHIDGPFLADVRRAVATAMPGATVTSLGQALAAIDDAVLTLHLESDQPYDKRSATVVRQHLVGLAAIVWLTARALSLESNADAILADIPF